MQLIINFLAGVGLACLVSTVLVIVVVCRNSVPAYEEERRETEAWWPRV